jgi:hypothetical protein
MGKALVVGLLVVLAGTSGAFADMVSPTFSFSGAQQSFTASLTAGGSATLSGSGTYYSWVGWPISSWASATVNFNNQTVGISPNPNPISINKDPRGNGQVSFERLFTTFDNGYLNDLNITDFFGGSPQGLALNPVQLNGSVDTPLGAIPVYLTLNTSGSLSNMNWDMNANTAFMYGKTGAFPSVTYSWLAGGNGGVDARLLMSGNLNVWGIFDVDLGTLLDTGTIHQDLAGLPLLGTMNLTELAGPYPKDVQLHINTDLSGLLPITVPFTTAGAYDYNNYPGGEGGSYFKIHVNYAFDGSLSVTSAAMDLYSTIYDIIPEPVTLAVFGLGAGLLTLARRRVR